MNTIHSVFTTDGGVTFGYDHHNNVLVDADGSPLMFGGGADFLEYVGYAQATYNSRKKSNKPRGLRLLMGHACNYSCTYCMQKDIGNPDELPRRKSLDKFFVDVTEQLDLTELDRVELWGGEPFLYWQDMTALMDFFDREGVTFAISTNGSCLHQKHVDFFATLKSQVVLSISHDGPRQLQLRGDEIFDRPRVINTLRAFDKLDNVRYGFQCSVTNTNFDLFAINDFFREKIVTNGLGTWNLYFSLGRTYQEKASGAGHLGCNVIEDGSPGSDSQLHVIHGENLEKFRTVLADFLEAHYEQFTRYGFNGDQPAVFSVDRNELRLLSCDIFESDIAYSVMEYARKTVTGEPILETTNCGADMADILSMDLDGAVRTCPHAGEKHIHGTLSNLKGVRIVSLDLNRKDSHCNGCINKKLCRSSCPLTLPDETFLTNCRVEKVWYGEIQKAAFRFIFGQKIQSVEKVA
jgi:radical SAM protein with 4Fe4S-binding SPASM domain